MSRSTLSPIFRGEQAIVIGGGMAGMLAAHSLAEYFEQITIVERDHYPDEPIFRPGVPQGRHVHTLLTRGVQYLEEFFPGFREKVLARGALPLDLTKDLRIRVASGWLPREASRLQIIACTRHLVEWQVRQDVLKHSRVRTIEGYEVAGLLEDGAKRVTGVQLRARGQENGENAQTTLTGELVIDASGRSSHAPQWLSALGYNEPEETVLNPYLGYACRLYAPADRERDWQGIAMQYDLPTNLRAGLVWPIEDGNWHVLLVGTSQDYPPTEDAAFLEFARALPDPAIYEAIKDAQPLSPIYGYRQTANRIRHYERLTRLPEGFVVIGDAACALNPIYGQGMTVALLGATTLREELRRRRGSDLKGLTKRFQQRLARVNQIPWQLATATDAKAPIVEARGIKESWTMHLTTPYFNRLLDMLPYDARARQIFLEVIHMLRPPASLLHPGLALSALRAGKKRNKNQSANSAI